MDQDDNVSEPAEPTRKAVPTPARHGRRLLWIILAVVVLLPVLGMAAWTAITLNYTYSEGQRAGFVQKLSKKGWICKTWEGDLAQVNIPGAAQEHFLFSVRNDSVAMEISKHMGGQVSLDYTEHRGVPGVCFGETNYFVHGVTAVH